MLTKTVIESRILEARLDCFGHYDCDDAICRDWCQQNIRCAVARRQYEDIEMFDDFFQYGAETSRIQ